MELHTMALTFLLWDTLSCQIMLLPLSVLIKYRFFVKPLCFATYIFFRSSKTLIITQQDSYDLSCPKTIDLPNICALRLLHLSVFFIDDVVQYCSITIANALEILQSCIKPSTWSTWRELCSKVPCGQQMMRQGIVLPHLPCSSNVISCYICVLNRNYIPYPLLQFVL